MPHGDLALQNGNQKRQPEAAIETAIEAAKCTDGKFSLLA